MNFLKKRLIFIFLIPSLAGASLLAQNGEINSTYDPFVDYSEFENTDKEKDSIDFFQTGRFLSLGLEGGAKLFTGNMALLYDIGPLYGAYLNYFFSLQFALQFSLLLSSHKVALSGDGSQPFQGGADFVSMGLDVKYFFDKNLFHQSLEWLRPFIIVGLFHSSVTLSATYTSQAGFYQDSGFGFNAGFGLEFDFSRTIHFGLLYAFRYVSLKNEAYPLRLVSVNNAQQNINFQPYGDWMNLSLLLGVNF